MAVNITSLGEYLQNELKVYDQTFYTVPEDELWGAAGLYVPSRGDLPLGVEAFTSFRRQFIGEASVTEGRAYDIPLADSGIVSSDTKAVMVMAGAEWSIVDLERAKVASSVNLSPAQNVIETKQLSVKTAIDRRIHRLVWAGMSEIGFGGLFNSSLIEVYNATGEGNLYGATTPKTPAELTDWFQARVATFKLSSRLPYATIQAYVDDSLYTALCKPLADNTGDTPYMRLTSADRGRFLGNIQPITELSPTSLQAAGIISSPTTRGRMLLGAFASEGSGLRHFYSMNRTEPFPKDTGVHFGLTGWAATSEFDVKIPEHFQYIDFAHS